MTNAERQQRFRDQMRAKGYVLCRIWCTPETAQKLREIAAKENGGSNERDQKS